MADWQKTVAGPVILEGVGVFSGKNIRVELWPAQVDAGIVFERSDLKGRPRIKLCPENVVGTEGATVLSDGKNDIFMVEHLLSALHGLGIDNVFVRVYGAELPLLDGSAELYVREIMRVGLKLQPKRKRYIEILRPFEVRNGVGRVTFKPASELRLSFHIHFDHPLIRDQKLSLRITPLTYQKELAFARTFGFKEELLRRKERGLLKGGSLQNAIVLDEKGLLNGDGLRTEDEFVRHKALDLLGDLYITGITFKGEISAEFSGHKLHIEAVKSLLAAPEITRLSDGLPPVALFFFSKAPPGVRPRL